MPCPLRARKVTPIARDTWVKAGEAFDKQGRIKSNMHHQSAQALVNQTLWAAARLAT